MGHKWPLVTLFRGLYPSAKGLQNGKVKEGEETNIHFVGPWLDDYDPFNQVDFWPYVIHGRSQMP